MSKRFKVLERVRAKLCRLAKRLSDGGAREKQTGSYRRKVKEDETLGHHLEMLTGDKLMLLKRLAWMLQERQN